MPTDDTPASWIWDEIEKTTAIYRALPDWVKPVICGPVFSVLVPADVSPEATDA
jgi:hypothetical protein